MDEKQKTFSEMTDLELLAEQGRLFQILMQVQNALQGLQQEADKRKPKTE
jgi:hypothetical protein